VTRALPVVSEYDPVKAGARCDLCPLKGNNVVPPKASLLPPKLVFVGEAPGRKEEIHGTPFIGQTGSFLRSLCREVDIDITEAVLQNASLCRSNIDKENEEAATYCAPRLLKELAALDPSIPIVTLGKTSTLSVLGVRSIMRARGFVWTARELDPAPAWSAAKKAKLRGSPKWKTLWLKAQIIEGRSKLAGRNVLPTVHPAFVLRSDTWLPILKSDLDRVARWVRGDLTRDTLLENGPYVVVTKGADVRRELRKLAPVISVDIETGPSKPGGPDGADPNRNRILCVGVSDGEHTVVIWPWRKVTHAPLLNAHFKRAKKISMHNGYNFDQISLARHGVPFEPIEDKLEDTLIAHHTFASHMPQRLGHVASVYIDAGPWKVTFKQGSGGASEKGLPPEKLSGEELCLYNAADARIQAQTWLAMQADLAPERMVYETDKVNARLCRSMIIGGIGVDLARREWLRDAITEKEGDLLAKMRKLLRRANFHPMQLAEVRKALFTILNAPLEAADPTDSGLPSTSQKTLERLKESPTRAGRFADLLLQWRGAVKIKSTYINSQVLDPPRKGAGEVGRTHFNWRSYGAASGRYSCRLQSAPRAEHLKDKSIVLETRVREVYVAKPGCKLVYYDLCFASGTMIDGPAGAKPIEKMCVGDLVYTYREATRRPAIGRVTQHIRVGRHPVLKVTLDNGAAIRCTPEHKWIVVPPGRRRHAKGPTPKGEPVDRLARDLRPGDRLLPLRKQIIGGREHLYAHDAFTYSKTHVEVAATTYGTRPANYDVHHKDDNPLNNAPGNLEYKLASKHKSDHGKEQAPKQWADPTIRAKMTAGLRRAAARPAGWCVGATNPRFGDRRRRGHSVCRQCERPFEFFKTRSSGVFCSRACAAASRRVTKTCLRCGLPVKQSRNKFCSTGCRDTARASGLNHKIVSVEPDGFAEVWSIAVDPDRNYALAAGVFVRNSQAEMRSAAYSSGDPTFMQTCQGDIHSGNAKILFPNEAALIGAEPKGRGKPFRDVAKNAGFGVTYLAEADTVFQFLRSKGFDVHYKDVVVMMDRMHEAYAGYFRYVQRNVRFVAKTGYMRSLLTGRIRWLGWHAPPTEVANFPIQSMIADLMNDRLPKIAVRLPQGARVVAQIHDAAIIETPERHVDRVQKLIVEAWAEPVIVPADGQYGGGLKLDEGARSFVMPIELKCKDRWSDFG
jgi:uracil-DNA glycosylase family 4